VQARNSLSEADAEMRLKAQQSNEKRVAAAHVVLCSLWEYEQTRVQVQRAWTLLMERIQNSR
jgi:dephospho-CoA kinase